MAARLLDSLWVGMNPLAFGGSVRFYAPKTLTQVNVYSDDAAQTIITQPIALDSNGRTSVPVYTTAPVRAVIFDSTGAQVLDVERINGDRAEEVAVSNTSWPTTSTVDAALTNIAATLGGKDGKVALTLAGATSRTLSSKLQDTVSVKDFGAKGDGVTDDTSAINACIASLTTGGSAFFPAGTYLISSPIAVSIANITLIGVGKTTSIIQNTAGAGNAITIGAVAGVMIRDLGITHSATSTGTAISHGGTAGVFFNVSVAGHRTGFGTVQGRIIACDSSTDNNAAGACFTTATSGDLYIVSCAVSGSATSACIKTASAYSGNLFVNGNDFSAANLGPIITTGGGGGSSNLIVNGNLIGFSGINIGTNYRSIVNANNAIASGGSGSFTDTSDTNWVTGRASTGTLTIDLTQSRVWKLQGTNSTITVTVNVVGGVSRDERVVVMYQNTSAGAVTWALSSSIVGTTPAPASTKQNIAMYIYDNVAAKLVQVGAISPDLANT